MRSAPKIILIAAFVASCLLLAPASGADQPRIPVTLQRQETLRHMATPVAVWDKQGWARSWQGDASSQFGPDVMSETVALSPSGAIYVAGNFLGTVDFDPSPDSEAKADSHKAYDCFLCKYDQSGSFEWVRTWGGDYSSSANLRVSARGLAADSHGNVYLTGDFMGTVDFDPNPDKDTTLVALGGESTDPFLLKLSPQGELLWAKDQSVSTASEYGWSCKVDHADNILWTGYYMKDTHGMSFFAKLDPAGNGVWYHEWEGSGGRDDVPAFIDIDNSNAAYIAGHIDGTTDLSGGQNQIKGTVNNHGLLDCYLSKWSSSGEFQWGKSWGNEQWDTCTGVAVDDAQGGVCVSGTVLPGDQPVNFSGDQNIPGGAITPRGSGEGYLVDFDAATGNLQTLFKFGGDQGGASCLGVSIDPSSNLLIIGGFSGTVNVAGDTLTAPAGQHKTYIARLSVLGSSLWNHVFDGTDTISPTALTTDPAGGGYVVGWFKGTADFAPTGIDQHSAGAKDAAFIVSYPADGNWGRLSMEHAQIMQQIK